ncbi:MAG: hypothetical protein J6Y02_10245 [Pseudobutyrivibrio sp.]|nr:hypothetical protein [Pseudobutyrivibrio sp.]
MLIYELFETRLNCEGWITGKNRIGLYVSKDKAYEFKQNWEQQWQDHKEQCKAVYPCWMDVKSTLEVKESITND